jgi:hypothetical protein
MPVARVARFDRPLRFLDLRVVSPLRMDRRDVSTKPRRLGWARAVYFGDVRDRVRCLKGGFGVVILNGSIAAAAKTGRTGGWHVHQ